MSSSDPGGAEAGAKRTKKVSAAYPKTTSLVEKN